MPLKNRLQAFIATIRLRPSDCGKEWITGESNTGDWKTIIECSGYVLVSGLHFNVLYEEDMFWMVHALERRSKSGFNGLDKTKLLRWRPMFGKSCLEEMLLYDAYADFVYCASK